MNKEIIKKAGEIIEQNTSHNLPNGSESFCVLALIDENGYPTASTITPSKACGISWITFCSGLESNKVKRIEKCNKASVCFNKDGAYNITLVGEIEVLTDKDSRHEMWYEGMSNHFKDADDPGYCVLKFKAKRYNLLVDWQEEVGTID